MVCFDTSKPRPERKFYSEQNPETKSAAEARPVAAPKRRPDRTRQTVLHSLFACAILAGVFGLFYALVGRDQGPSTKVAEDVRPQDNQIGHIKITGEADCKKRLFDNASGAVVGTHGNDCTASTTQHPTSLYVTPTNRLDAVRRGFNTR